ncbi:MAG: hypothetical protein HY928_01345 [Elusimicrobia bacterium]|nr:hypothetical protein [Elusimicrobiota bacterium]
MTLILLAALLAFPARAEPPEPGPSLTPAETAIEAGIKRHLELTHAFEAGATVYAQAEDLPAVSEERRKGWQELLDAFWTAKKDIRQYRRELGRRELAAAAHAFNTRNVDEAKRRELSGHLQTASRLELAHKASFRRMQAAQAADSEALRAEWERRRESKRLRRRAWSVFAACAAAVILFMLAGKRRRPPPSPPKRPVLLLPKGPGRLE